LLITYNNKSAFLNHVTQIAIVIKLEQALVLQPGFIGLSTPFPVTAAGALLMAPSPE
jgi:hypothetical protein